MVEEPGSPTMTDHFRYSKSAQKITYMPDDIGEERHEKEPDSPTVTDNIRDNESAKKVKQRAEDLVDWLTENPSGNQVEFEAKHSELNTLLIQIERMEKSIDSR
eukprot:UN3435